VVRDEYDDDGSFGSSAAATTAAHSASDAYKASHQALYTPATPAEHTVPSARGVPPRRRPPQATQAPPVILEAYLQKQAQSGARGTIRGLTRGTSSLAWQRRWVVLDAQFVTYFTTKPRASRWHHAGRDTRILVADIRSVILDASAIVDGNGQSCCFTVETPSRALEFKAADPTTAERWVNAIQRLVVRGVQLRGGSEGEAGVKGGGHDVGPTAGQEARLGGQGDIGEEGDTVVRGESCRNSPGRRLDSPGSSLGGTPTRGGRCLLLRHCIKVQGGGRCTCHRGNDGSGGERGGREGGGGGGEGGSGRAGGGVGGGERPMSVDTFSAGQEHAGFGFGVHSSSGAEEQRNSIACSSSPMATPVATNDVDYDYKFADRTGGCDGGGGAGGGGGRWRSRLCNRARR
jgi:hypothetical protein